MQPGVTKPVNCIKRVLVRFRKPIKANELPRSKLTGYLWIIHFLTSQQAAGNCTQIEIKQKCGYYLLTARQYTNVALAGLYHVCDAFDLMHFVYPGSGFPSQQFFLLINHNMSIH
jgi:hypothetical protein